MHILHFCSDSGRVVETRRLDVEDLDTVVDRARHHLADPALGHVHHVDVCDLHGDHIETVGRV